MPEHPGWPPAPPAPAPIIADWDRARRATGYRVKVQVPVEAEARGCGLFADDQATLTGLSVGGPLIVSLVAHNGSGDGPAGPAAAITLA